MKKRVYYPNIPLLFFSFFIFSASCHSEMISMTDEQMDEETGKGFSISMQPTGSIYFSMDEQTKGGTPISVSGSLEVLKKAQDININQDILSLSGAAQENLQALVSVNAVDSLVQVLVNMNVNINSTVGIVDQANQALQNREFLLR